MATNAGRNIMCTKASPVTNAPDRIRLGEGLSELQTRASFWNPIPARALHLFLNPYLGLKTKFTEWIKICTTAGIDDVAKYTWLSNSQIFIFHWRFKCIFIMVYFCFFSLFATTSDYNIKYLRKFLYYFIKRLLRRHILNTPHCKQMTLLWKELHLL